MPRPAPTPDPRGRLFAGLDPAQAAAIGSDARVVVVLAGAGSGKTRVLIHRIARRIADGSAESRHVLAVTFTRKAAGELRERLAGLLGGDVEPGQEPAVHTFHALGGALLARWWADHRQPPRRVTRRRPQLLAEAVEAARSAAPPGSSLAAPTLGAEIEWAKARALYPRAYLREAQAWGRRVEVDAVAGSFAAYEVLKRRRGVLDVDDLIVEALRLLEGDPVFARGQRFWYRHILVDEFQDVTPAQFRLLRALLGPDPDLCVVGDPNQAIYGWNGADPGLLADLAHHLPGGAGVEVHRLETNHRCRLPIVAAAAAVLGVPVPSVPPVPEEHEEGLVPVLQAYGDEAAEAAGIARGLQEARWRARRGWGAMAVLTRTGAQLDPVAAALRARGIPYLLPGSLLDRSEVRAVLGELRRVDGGSRRPMATLRHDLVELCQPAALGLPFDSVVPVVDEGDHERVGDEMPPPAPVPEVELRRAQLTSLVELVDEFCRLLPRGGLDEFAFWAAGVLGARGADAAPQAGRVALLTFHRAKGLEWPVVFVAGCADGWVPHRLATTEAHLAEERRLAYVALTRAGEELHCSWPRSRRAGRGTRRLRPSPLLGHLALAGSPVGAVSPPSASAVAVASAG